MKNKAIGVPVLAIMILLVSWSCKKETRDDTAAADVYVKSVLSGGVPVFGLVHTVMGRAAMAEVTVTTPGGATQQLTGDSQRLIFYNLPLTPDTYSATPPQAGTYIYDITFDDGVKQVVTNDLGNDYLTPPVITSITKSTDGLSVNLTWEELLGVEYFTLTIYRQKTALFTSEPFAPVSGNTINVPKAVITDFQPGWSYKYQLDAFIYESQQTGQLQSASSSSVSITL
jgi:hypothetical protein